MIPTAAQVASVDEESWPAALIELAKFVASALPVKNGETPKQVMERSRLLMLCISAKAGGLFLYFPYEGWKTGARLEAIIEEVACLSLDEATEMIGEDHVCRMLREDFLSGESWMGRVRLIAACAVIFFQFEARDVIPKLVGTTLMAFARFGGGRQWHMPTAEGLFKAIRNAHAYELYVEGASISELAYRSGLSVTSMYRAMDKERKRRRAGRAVQAA